MTPKKTNDLFNGLFTETENFFKEKGYNTWHSSSCCEDELVLRAIFPHDSWVRKSGVQYIVEPGGSIRDDHVIMTANRYNMTMCFTEMRLFHH